MNRVLPLSSCDLARGAPPLPRATIRQNRMVRPLRFVRIPERIAAPPESIEGGRGYGGLRGWWGESPVKNSYITRFARTGFHRRRRFRRESDFICHKADFTAASAARGGGSPVKRNIPISPGSQEPDFTAKGDFAAKAISLVGSADEFHCGACRRGVYPPKKRTVGINIIRRAVGVGALDDPLRISE